MAGCRCNGKKSIPAPPQALRLVFDDIANVPVADASNISDWNTFFDLPNLGGAFTSVEINGNDVILKGGSNIKVKPGLLYDIGYQYLVSIDDTGCITSVGGDAFSYCNKLTDVNLPECTIIYGWEDSPYEDYGGFGTCLNLLNINIPKLESIGNWGFGSCISLTTIDLPSCNNLGTTTDYNNVFNNISGNTITLTVPSALMTCNIGNPDGDIQYLQSNNTVTITTV